MTENFKELFEESLKTTEMRLGKIIKAKIIDISKEFVRVDAGLKSESLIALDEFKNSKKELNISVHDEIDVVLESLDNNNGETSLSRLKAKRIEIWNNLESACNSQEIVTGRIINHVRGGYTVEIQELKAFLPGSLVDIRPIRDISHLENKDIEVKIVKLDPKRNNIVVSRKAVIEAEGKEEREKLLKTLKEGTITKGIVKNITDFGAFIDLGGVDGLLHITDISWSRIKHPSDILAFGDEITVKIIKFDEKNKRISLGIKQLGNDPWEHIAQELKIGSKITGTVTNITDYGCFVKIKEGIEGLVHTSEMDWTNKNVNPYKVVSINQEIEVKILEIDAGRHRISLGIKQCKMNPWNILDEKYNLGDVVTGKIRSITDFGIFIGLEGEIDGLIHISDVAWKGAETVIKNYKKDDEIQAVMLSVDVDRERVSLGIKQLHPDEES